MNNLVQVQGGDSIGITVLDEAGNQSNPGADSVAILDDHLVPLITTGEVVAGTGTVEIMTLTYAEPVCVNDPLTNLCVGQSADLIGNYYLNSTSDMSTLPGPITAAVDPTGMIVTLTAPTGFGVLDGIYLVLAEVEDLQGNSQDIDTPNPGGALWFAVDDNIAPVMTSCYHPVGPVGINSSNPAVASDGEWTVGDAVVPPVMEMFSITCDLSEELDTGVSVAYSGAATCSRTGTLTLTPADVTFTITCTAGTVAAADRIDVSGVDLAGNPLSPAIILNAVGLGTNINPIVP
jgi:hypothetical protein